MNATNDSGLADRGRTISPPSTLSGSRWTKERETLREVCVQRSRAAFLTARWLKLKEDCDSASTDVASVVTDAEETRKVLRQVIQHYARLLVELGEPRDAIMLLVEELSFEAEAGHGRSADVPMDEMRRELTGWAAHAMAAD